MEIIKCLEENEVVASFFVSDLKVFDDGFYIRIHASLNDNTLLHIREYVDAKTRSYSYHWQTPEGKLIQRWDNAPHHKKLENYPHHTHRGKRVHPSYQISCRDILKAIRESLD